MANSQINGQQASSLQKTLLYHFCRLRLPELRLSFECFDGHLHRCYRLYQAKSERNGIEVNWPEYFRNLYSVDWFLCCACLERSERAWDYLFASRVMRSDCLLVDALHARAVRLFPANEERQENAVSDFWGYLLAGEKEGSVPILARYDGQRPLIPWLIRVFQNKVISKEFRTGKKEEGLHEDDLEEKDFQIPFNNDGRWNDEFRDSAREWLSGFSDDEILLLGLRFRYRQSQREVASLIGIHEGNVSKRFTKISTGFMDQIRESLLQAGWTGDDLDDFIRQEMGSLLLEEPRLSADHLAALLAKRGKSLDEVLIEEESDV